MPKQYSIQRKDTSGFAVVQKRRREVSPKGEVIDLAESVDDPTKLFRIVYDKTAKIEVAYPLPESKADWP